jgi:hypothetical protein
MAAATDANATAAPDETTEAKLAAIRLSCEGAKDLDAYPGYLERFAQSSPTVADAIKRFDKHIVWRRNFQTITLSVEDQEAIASCFQCGFHGLDRQGKPVYIQRIGQMDLGRALRLVDFDTFMHYIALQFDDMVMRALPEATAQRGYPITSVSGVIDLQGFTMRLFNSDGKKVLKAIMRLIEFNYPEAISTLRIVNAPKIFHIVWKVIKGWMHPDTLKKVKVSSGTDVLDDLMDRPLLPTFFGGTLRFGNGEVDESGYLSAVESEGEGSTGSGFESCGSDEVPANARLRFARRVSCPNRWCTRLQRACCLLNPWRRPPAAAPDPADTRNLRLLESTPSSSFSAAQPRGLFRAELRAEDSARATR